MKIYKGIFWFIHDELIVRKVMCDKDGNALEYAEFSSKRGSNFNHKKEWSKLSKNITSGKAFNYYPRGRVEVRRNEATIYLNPTLNDDSIVE